MITHPEKVLFPDEGITKGFHIAVPLDGKAGFGEVARFAHTVGTILVKRDPKHLTQEFSKADRGGRILVDTGRNGFKRHPQISQIKKWSCNVRSSGCKAKRALTCRGVTLWVCRASRA